MSLTIKRNILLNPGPVTTSDSVKHALLVPDICHREEEFTSLLKSIRNDLLKVINAQDDYTSVLFCSSGTGALEACISSVINANEKIAIINNGAYGQRLIDIAKRYQIQVVEINFPYNKPLSLQQIEKVLAADPAIRFVAMVHHETSSGLLNPLREVAQLCQRLQRKLIVDAMSSFAGCEIDVAKDPVDFIISSSNKCLHGMPGISFVIAKKSTLSETQGNARSYYLDLHQQYQALEETGQMPFTPPVQIAYAFKQALNEFFIEGGKARIERYKNNYLHLIDGLQNLGFEIILPEARQSQLLVSVKFPNNGFPYDFDHLHDYLYHRGYTIYPRKLAIENSFRLACIGELGVDDIKNFLKVLETYMHTLPTHTE